MKSLFGTDGIRTRFGTSPLTPLELVQLGSALALWAQKKKPSARIVIGHDTRQSAHLLKAALTAGLLQHPVTLFDAEVIATPALFYLTTKTDSYDFGIMLTASHNYYQDNGIKIFSQKEGKLSATNEQEITKLFYESTPSSALDALGTIQKIDNPLNPYHQALLASCPRLDGIKLVIDCANGATSNSVPALLTLLGAEVITINAHPSGININHECGSVHPQQLCQAVVEHQAHAGFAFDGDGDRICAVTADGTVRDGDELLSFLLAHPQYQKNSCMVATLMSNQGLEELCKKKNLSFVRTPVGDKYVIERMKQEKALIGGEPSGHLILRDFSDTSDALCALLRIVETAQITNNWTLTGCTKFPQALINTPVAHKKDLTQEPFATLIASHQAELGQGRVIVRYSGTENLLRVMVEAETDIAAQKTCLQLTERLTKALHSHA